METPPVAAAPAPAPKPAKNNTWLVGVVGGLVALCICIGIGAAGLLLADPFGWHLLERAQGRYDPLAYAIPTDAMMYGSVDLLQLQSAELKNALGAFADTPAFEGQDADAVKKLEENLKENWDISLTDDILPWAGQYVGFTVHKLEMRSGGSGVKESQVVFLFEARDAKAAQAFITKFTTTATEKQGLKFIEETYQGVTLYLAEEEGEAALNIAYSNGLVLLSNSAEALKATVDAQQTPTAQLGTTPSFKTDLASRAKQYVFYLYIPSAGLRRYLEDNADAVPNATASLQGLDALNNMSVVFRAVDEGLRLDMTLAYDESKLSADQKSTLQYSTHEVTFKQLPADTLTYIVLEKFNLIWEIGLKNVEDPEAIEDSMALVEKQLGFNPSTDLFPYLDGDLAFALVPDEAGVMVEAYDLNMGLVALAQTTHAAELQETLDKFNSKIEDNGLAPETEELAGVEAYTLDAGMKDPALVYGLPEGWLGIATSTDAFTNAFDGGDSLADSAAHKAVWANFPAGTTPSVYIDIQALIKVWSDSKMAGSSFEESTLPYLQPMLSLAAGSTPLQNGIIHSTMILRLQKP